MVEELAHHLAHAPDSEYVFSSSSGRFLDYGNFRKRFWAPAVDRSGLAPLRFHELRHSAAAILIDLGANPIDIRDWLGHEDVSTTLDVYGHRFPKRDSELAVKLDNQNVKSRYPGDRSAPVPWRHPR